MRVPVSMPTTHTTRFAGQTGDLKLGHCPVEVKDLPKQVVAGGIQHFERSPFGSYAGKLPQDAKLKIYRDPELNVLLVEIADVPDDKKLAVQIPTSDARGVGRALSLLVRQWSFNEKTGR